MANSFSIATASRYPRTKLVGGFEVSTAAATAWASRLTNTELDPIRNWPTVLDTIREKICPHGADFMDVSEDSNPAYMVVTQFKQFPKGYKGMDPKFIPQFREGEPEVIARKLLEEEGK